MIRGIRGSNGRHEVVFSDGTTAVLTNLKAFQDFKAALSLKAPGIAVAYDGNRLVVVYEGGQDAADKLLAEPDRTTD